MALAMRCVNASSAASSSNAALIAAGEIAVGSAAGSVDATATGADLTLVVARAAEAPARFLGACKIRIGAAADADEDDAISFTPIRMIRARRKR